MVPPRQAVEVGEATEGDLPAIEAIASSAFTTGRFLLDGRLDPAAEPSTLRELGPDQLRERTPHGAQGGGRPAELVGFFIAEHRPDGVVYWHLTAMAPAWQGKGLGLERVADDAAAAPDGGRDVDRDDDLRPQPCRAQSLCPARVLARVRRDDLPSTPGAVGVRVCSACGSDRCDAAWRCADCGHSPTSIAGFPAFAPELASANSGFREDYFRDLAALEAGNFWFRARNKLIIWAMQTYRPDCERFLEVGCGTGFVLSGIRTAFPSAELSGSEIFSAGLAFAAERVPSATFYQMDARAIPFRDHFDVIGAFDVLEHIDDDRR